MYARFVQSPRYLVSVFPHIVGKFPNFPAPLRPLAATR